MVEWEDIKENLNCLEEVFISNWRKILSYSFILLLSFPIIKWSVLSILYTLFKTPSLLEKFGESTAFNLLPWWLDFLVEPVKTAGIYLLFVTLVTGIYTIFGKRE